MSGKRVNLNLELELDGGRLSGRATDSAGDGEGKSFSGWLGLVGAIDRLLGGDDAQASAAPASNRTEAQSAR